MKKLLLILLLLSQVIFSQEMQIMNLGTSFITDTDNKVVPHINYEWLTHLETNNEFGVYISYASLQQSYASYGLLYNRQLQQLSNDKFNVLVGATLGGLTREYKSSVTYIDYGINTQLRFNINNSVGIYTRTSLKPRDLNNKIYFKNEIGIFIAFQ